MARPRMAVLYDRSVTWSGLVVGHGQQDRVAHRLHDALRRLRRARSTRSATCTRARSASSPRRSASPTRSSARRRRPTCGPARPTRPRPASAMPCSTGCCTGWSTAGAPTRSSSALGFDPALIERVGPDGRGLRVQAPGAADRQARAADGRASTTSTRGAGPAPPGADGGRRAASGGEGRARRPAVRRRDADRQPGRRHAPRARGAARRCPLIAAEDTRITRRLLAALRDRDAARPATTPGAPGRAGGADRAPRRRGDLALVTDAGTPRERPRRRARRGLGGARRRGRADPRRVGGARRARGERPAGPRWGFEGFLPRRGRERRERLARIAADARGASCSRPRAGWRRPWRTSPRPVAPGTGGRLPGAHEGPRGVRAGGLGELAAAALAGEIKARGEFAIVVGPGSDDGLQAAAADAAAGVGADPIEAARAEVAALVAPGSARGEAARRVAEHEASATPPVRRTDEGGGRRWSEASGGKDAAPDRGPRAATGHRRTCTPGRPGVATVEIPGPG